MTYSNDFIQRTTGTRSIVKKIVSQPYTSLVLLGSLLLSGASFFTTYSGMIDFTDHWLINFCIVFAIQGLLFVTSWRIGFAVAERERMPFFTVFVFLICLATSVFFSFAALNDYVNTPETRERKRVERMRAAVDSANAAAAQRLAGLRTDAIDALIAAPTFADWERGLDAVAAAAGDARETIAATRNAEARTIEDRIAALQATRDQIVRDQGASSARLDRLQERVAALRSERAPLVERIAALRGEIQELNEEIALKEGLMRAEESGSVSGTGAGRGPAWRALFDERNIIAARRDAKDQALLDAQNRLSQLESAIDEVSAEIAVAGGADTGARVTDINAEIAGLRGRIGAAGDGGDALAGEVAEMRAALAAFKSRQAEGLTDLDRTIALCGGVVDELRAISAPGAGALSCEPRAQLLPFVSQSRNAVRLEEGFVAACSRGAAQPPLSERGFDDAAAFGLGCIDILARNSGAAATAEEATFQEALRQRINQVRQDEDPNATRYERAVSEFLLGDKLAYSAAAIALFIDLLVLFSGLIGALSSSGKLQLALGRILTKSEIEDFERALRPNVASFILGEQRALTKSEQRKGKNLTYGAVIDLNTDRGDARTRAQARAFLIAQKTKGLASVGRHEEALFEDSGAARALAPSATSDQFYLSDELMRALRAYLETPESHRIDGLPIAGGLSDIERRQAARQIRMLARPYRGKSHKVGDWAYVARVDLAAIDKEMTLDRDSVLRQNAAQVLLGLYTEGLARPVSILNTPDEEPRIYLLKSAGLELLDQAGSLTAAEAEAIDKEHSEQAERAAVRRRIESAQARAKLPAPEPAPAPAPSDASPEAPAEASAETLDLRSETDGPERIRRDEPRATPRRPQSDPAPEANRAEGARESVERPDDADSVDLGAFMDKVGQGGRYRRQRSGGSGGGY